MKGQSATIFAVAVGASILAHGLLWTTTHSLQVDYGGIIGAAGQGTTHSSLITINLDPTGVPRDDFSKLPEEPPKPQPKPKLEPDRLPDRMGRQDGDGIGTQEAKGPTPMQAREGDNDQPYLSRDPRGPANPKEPTPVTQMPGDGGTGGRAGAAAVAEVLPSPPIRPPQPQPVDHAEEGESRPGPIAVKLPTAENAEETPAEKIDPKVADRSNELTLPKPGVDAKTPEGERPIHPLAADGMLPPPPQVVLAKSPPPAPLPMRVPPAAEPQVVLAPTIQAPIAKSPLSEGSTDGAGGRPGPQAAADPAQQSDSEVDPFSKIGTWTIPRDGSVPVQFGRQVRPIRPHLNVAGMLDASLGARLVTLRVHIAADGRVSAVDIERSSGSNEVDQPCLVAMYDWWFEPLKNKKGDPIPDIVHFTLRFR